MLSVCHSFSLYIVLPWKMFKVSIPASVSLYPYSAFVVNCCLYLCVIRPKVNGPFYFLALFVFKNVQLLLSLANIFKVLSNRLRSTYLPNTDGKMLFSVKRHQKRISRFWKFVIFYEITDLCYLDQWHLDHEDFMCSWQISNVSDFTITPCYIISNLETCVSFFEWWWQT